MSLTLTPNFITFSDSQFPIIPSTLPTLPTYPLPTVSTPCGPTKTTLIGTPSPCGEPSTSTLTVYQPTGATVIFPNTLPLPANYDLNKDERVHKQVTKYFRYKTLDKWLYEDMADLLNWFRVDANGVHLINNTSEYREDSFSKDSDDIKEKKIDYIERYFLTFDTMHKILSKFVKGTGINWYDLTRNELFVKEDIKDKLKQILKDTVTERSVMKK